MKDSDTQPVETIESGEPVAWRFTWANDSLREWQYLNAEPKTDKLRLGIPGVLNPDSGRKNWEPVYAAPQSAHTAKSGESAHEKVLDALKIADRFCDSLTSEVCPDDVAIPIKDALRALTLAAPQPSPTAVVLGDERKIVGPVTVDRTHKNQAYVTIGFGSIDECSDFLRSLNDLYTRKKPRAAFPQPVAQTERALAMDAGELDEFDRTASDFECDGETTTDYGLLLDWAQRGLLECTHFEVTKAGKALLNAAQPASGENHE